MGQVRSILRAYAIDHPDPSEVLERTNAALARLRTLAAHDDHASRTGEQGALGPGQPRSQ